MTEVSKELNHVDMQPDGSRFCFLYEYADFDDRGKYTEKCIESICLAWGVVEHFDVDVYLNGKSNECCYDECRNFLLKFDDDLWRQASFGGRLGTPQATCQSNGIKAASSEIAYLNIMVHLQKERIRHLLETLNKEQELYAEVQEKLLKKLTETKK